MNVRKLSISWKGLINFSENLKSYIKIGSKKETWSERERERKKEGKEVFGNEI